MEKLAQLDVNTGLGPMSKCEVQPFNAKVSLCTEERPVNCYSDLLVRCVS